MTENTENTENTNKTIIVDEERKKSYVSTRAASGAKSLSNGDDIAICLTGLTLDQVYEVADKILDVEEDLRAKYKERNAGMQRMIVGNRIRAFVKSEKDGTADLKDLQVITAPMHKINEFDAAEKVKAAEKAKAEKAKAAAAKKAAKKAA